jgi:hypothetical protein
MNSFLPSLITSHHECANNFMVHMVLHPKSEILERNELTVPHIANKPSAKTVHSTDCPSLPMLWKTEGATTRVS